MNCKAGDVYECESCGAKVMVTAECDCEECTLKLECCGKPMKKQEQKKGCGCGCGC